MKAYTCNYCRHVTMSDKKGITYIQCEVCGHISAEELHHSDVIVDLHHVIHRVCGMHVLIAPICNGKRFKFRWFNSIDAEAFRSLTEDLISDVLLNHGYKPMINSRTFKRYRSDNYGAL